MKNILPVPRWLSWCSRHVLRLGPTRATLALTLLVCLLSIGTAELMVLLLGHADPVLTSVVCSLVLTPLIAGLVLMLIFQLERTRHRLGVLTTQDELTGVPNRRHFMSLATREWARSRRYDTFAALLLIDADHFKRVNDTYGHLCGDAILREITRLTSQSLRESDLLARFGGEELIVFLPHTDPLGALDVAERVRERVARCRMTWGNATVCTTVSIGVASLGPDHVSLDAMIRDADAALYAAKEAGRNCVRAAPIQPRRSGETSRVASPR